MAKDTRQQDAPTERRRYPDTDFEETGRVRTSDHVEVCISRILRGTGKSKEMLGYSISKYVEATRFTGFTKGTFIPEDKITEFLRLFGKENLEFALEGL